ncbi:transmembrane amino acid transporter protein-domain-containing protein [Aspergillus caelatus]|uniref:Transmembrane amino acid transporter protein-domain-containing protein n=1 Tax=Aspergillus caelatus TaxID=61420 RepID=A0A5N7AE33_9EURO|nr:transmembrane amino acid transporter protein-domain-containing protein [Aspergillus caelatus]KAE8368124.1 transmembrane amino acid transporter protein-domain-containing protein [Aspergillus caelatus]
MTEKREDLQDLGKYSYPNEGDVERAIAEDGVFGTITEDGPNYRNLGWIGTSVIMMKIQIGLGVLSIPSAFDTLGLIPGVICLLCIAFSTTWSSYIVGVFKLNHREVYGIDDATSLILGPVGREILGAGFMLYLVFAAASGMLSISIALNTVSTHGACTAVFVGTAAICILLLASIRTLDRISILAWLGLVTLLCSLFTVTIAIAIQDHPDSAPPGPWVSDYKLFNNPTFTDAISAVSQFVFAYAGPPFFFPVISEMRKPQDYPKALALCQTIVTITYVVIGIVVYYYCGSYVASPALGSAGKLIKQISYGVALPGILIASTISTHLASKYVFVRILRNSDHLVANTFVHWGTWLASVVTLVIIEYCISSGIPIFDSLVSLIGSLLATLQCYQPMAGIWLYDNWSNRQRPLVWVILVCWSFLMIIGGTFLMIGGTYGAIAGIIDSFKSSERPGIWSCADNSNSV